jgi:23S rRNA (uracil1939-C5)-methyltransferase
MDSIRRFWPEDFPERLHYTLPEYDLTLAFHPADFTQVNADINRKMIQRAIDLLALNSEDEVLDLFCGLGNFTLPLAKHCKHVTGVEGVETMVERGYENASANNITNADFACVDLFKPEQVKWVPESVTKVLLDPPRSGAIEVLPQVVACEPERIVYVSCNPATLARDAGILQQHGYVLKSAGVMDMFPHTTHVESIALFMKE